MLSFEEMMALLGVFLPLLGLAATFLLAWSCEAVFWRWTILVVGPALTFLVFVAFLEPIADVVHLLAVAMFLGLIVFLTFYYPALIIAGLVAWRRAR